MLGPKRDFDPVGLGQAHCGIPSPFTVTGQVKLSFLLFTLTSLPLRATNKSRFFFNHELRHSTPHSMFVSVILSSKSHNLHGTPRRLHDAKLGCRYLSVTSILWGRVRHTAVYLHLLRSRIRLSYLSSSLHSPRCPSVPLT